MLLSLGVFVMVGCNDNKSADFGVNIIRSDVEFDANGGTGTISFAATGVVSVRSDKEWLQIASTEPKSVSFTVSPCKDIMSRSAMIEITAGEKTEVVTVTQMGVVLDTPESFTVAPAKISTVLDLYVNTTDLTVSSADSWANAKIEQGKLVVTPESNPGRERRTTLTVTSNWKTVKVTLIQLPFPETSDVKLDGLGNPLSFEVHQSIETLDDTWSVKATDDWLHAQRDGSNVVVTADKNETMAPRTSTVMLSVDNMNIPIVVTQSGIVDFYNYYLGEWILSYKNGAATDTITLVQQEYNESYTLKGLRFDLVVTYNNSNKQLGLVHQKADTINALHIFFCAQSSVSGDFTWKKNSGFNLLFNGDEANNLLQIVDNGVWVSSKADGFLLYAFSNATPSNDNRVAVIRDYENVVSLHR